MMLSFLRFSVRARARRRSAAMLPRVAEVCESRLLLSTTTSGEVVEDPAVDPVMEEPATDPTMADPSGSETGSQPPPPPPEDPPEDPGDPPPPEGSETPPVFVAFNVSRVGNTVTVTGQVNSLTGGDTVDFGGVVSGSVTVDAQGFFSFSFSFAGTGILSATATDLNGIESDTLYELI